MPGFFSVLRGMTGTLKTSPQSFCDCLLPAHAASGPDVTAQSLRCLDVAAQSLRCLDVAAQSLRCPPSLLRHPFAFRKGRPLRGSCIYWPTAAPLVGNSPRGWAPKTLPSPEVRGDRADEATPHRLLACRYRQTLDSNAPVAIVYAAQQRGRSANQDVCARRRP
jgi:hypothetical protein